MKIARFFANVFAVIGTVLLIGSIGFFLMNRNADVRVLELPQQAVACSDAFAQTLNQGDLEAAAKLMYGQPDLGVSAVPQDPESAAVWEAFLGSISFEFTGKCYAEQAGHCQCHGKTAAADSDSGESADCLCRKSERHL